MLIFLFFYICIYKPTSTTVLSPQQLTNNTHHVTHLICRNHLAYRDDGRVVTDQATFRDLYRRRQLRGDVIASLPLAPVMLALCVSRLSSSSSTDITVTVALPWFYRGFVYARLLLLVRLQKLGGVWTNLLAYIDQTVLKGKQQLDGSALRVGIFVVGIWSFVHVVACLFVYLGFYQLERFYNQSPLPAPEEGVSWVWDNDVDLARYSAAQVYLRAYFWAAYTVITVGYGSISLGTWEEGGMHVSRRSISYLDQSGDIFHRHLYQDCVSSVSNAHTSFH